MNITPQKKPAFLIAAPKSNSGKTIVTLGLLQAFKDRGYKVQPFKCGPDYIDPMHHTSIAGQPSYNLDTWMSSSEHVTSLFNELSSQADVAVVEGVMGLFDGAKKDKGSSAEVAKLLNLPVILVIDAGSMAYSAAPLLYGYKHFDTEVNMAGVIFNKVSGESHYQFLKEAAEDVGIESLGYIPQNQDIVFESRHLGLFMPQDKEYFKPVKLAAQLIEQHVCLDKLIEITKKPFEKSNPVITHAKPKLTIAIANDKAFNFMYPANIKALNEIAEVIFFSPLNDTKLPESDLIWLPGGYPELFARELSENTIMLEQIKKHGECGKAIIAECGGMMYLGKTLVTKDRADYQLCGLFNYATSTQNMKLNLGYRKIEINQQEFYGHEFHYSQLVNAEEAVSNCHCLSANNHEINLPVFRKKKIWASYLHLYLGESEKMKNLIQLILND